MKRKDRVSVARVDVQVETDELERWRIAAKADDRRWVADWLRSLASRRIREQEASR